MALLNQVRAFFGYQNDPAKNPKYKQTRIQDQYAQQRRARGVPVGQVPQIQLKPTLGQRFWNSRVGQGMGNVQKVGNAIGNLPITTTRGLFEIPSQTKLPFGMGTFTTDINE